MRSTLPAVPHAQAGEKSDRVKSSEAVVATTAPTGLALRLVHPWGEIGSRSVLVAVLMALPLRHFSRPTSA